MSARKPSWMLTETWSDLLGRYGGIPRCAETGETDDLSVDHIVPTYHGGTDDVSNLQFLKRALNSKKGIRPDRYWSGTFYFDHIPDLAQCRAAQRTVHRDILAQADWFSEPASAIARLLYVLPMVVGSGKTLAILMAGCSYNTLIRARWGAARRADRILVLVKERAIRDQLARDLETDVVRFGIMPSAPRVGIIRHGWQFDNSVWLGAHDIIVACIQQLWDGERDLPKLFDNFPVIFIDEPHFAPDRVKAIVEMAKNSVCFGGTGTPIDGAGDLLDRIIRVSTFSYRDADAADRSVKFLAPEVRRVVHENLLAEATILDAKGVSTRTDTTSSGYGKNFEPAKTVAWHVIHHMEQCDNIDLAHAEKAPHRLSYECEVSVTFPIHAMIVCDNVRFANHLAKTINEALDRQRSRFPRPRGWHAEVVHAEGEEADGGKRADKPLLLTHPWLRFKEKHELDGSCSRILIVVGMGREGVNNPYCGVVGITSDHASVVEVVQRLIGRQVRAVTATKEDGTLCVPPAQLDTVTIISHPAFDGALDVLQQGIDFVLNMDDYLEDLPTIADLQQERDIRVSRGEASEPPLPFPTKIEIAGLLGSNPDVDINGIVEGYGGGNPRKEQKIIEWVKAVRVEPSQARRQLRLTVELAAVDTVLAEAMTRNPTDAQLKAFLRAKFRPLADGINEATRPWAEALYRQDAEAVSAATPPLLNLDGTKRNIDHVRKSIAGTIHRHLGQYLIRNRDNDALLHRLIGSAVKLVLGIPTEKQASNDSQWDVPACLMILERGDIQRDIRAWVIARLIDRGCCPALKALHGDQGDDSAASAA